MASRYFTKNSFTFLRKLAKNNTRDWFLEHKDEYEETIRSPALEFIADMTDDLAMLSPHFLAVPKKVGGSLMRVNRDVRFGKDKRPYKTNIGIQFRHEQGKDVHAPGFYLHIEPNDCFVGIGIWRPDADALGKIRDRISAKGKDWTAALTEKPFKRHFELGGESLKRPPRGYDKEHPLLESLKRKDFIAFANISNEIILNSRFKKMVIDRFRIADSYMQFLCKALELRY